MIKKILSILVTCNLLLVASATHAADLFFETDYETIGVGEVAEAVLYLNSPENVNAIEGEIVLPTGLEVREVSDGSTIISFWVEQPQQMASGNQQVIKFAGVVPGGYAGQKGKIFSFKITGKDAGLARINIQDAQALLNDGEGSATTLSLPVLDILVVTESVVGEAVADEDKTPPEYFKPEIAQDSSLFDGQYFLVFATQDKQSGMGHFEITEIEHIFLKPSPDEWIKATSPYLLEDQELKSWIFIKAVDNQGNERIIAVEPTHIPVFQRALTTVLGLILLLLVVLIVRRRSNGNKGKSTQT